MLDPKNVTLGGEEVANRFGHHKAAIEGPTATPEDHAELRQQFMDLANLLDWSLPESREKSVAFTELETASMWAHKALAKSNPLAED